MPVVRRLGLSTRRGTALVAGSKKSIRPWYEVLNDAVSRIADMSIAGDIGERIAKEGKRLVVGNLLELAHLFNRFFLALRSQPMAYTVSVGYSITAPRRRSSISASISRV